MLACASSVALLSCGLKGSKEASRGPGSSNRDPRGSIEYCSDPEKSKTRTECGAGNSNNSGLQLRLADSNLSVAAGDSMFLNLYFEVTEKDLGDIKVVVTSPTETGIPAQEVVLPSYSTGTSFCFYVPPETAQGKITLRIEASGVVDGGDQQTSESRLAVASPVQAVAQVTAPVAGATRTGEEACKDTTFQQ